MKRKILAGTTSFSLPIFVAATNSTTGGGLAGLVHNTSGLVAEYRRQGQATWTAITLASGKTLGTYLSSGFIADGALEGAYEIDVPNAAVAASARFVLIRLRGAANMLPVLIEIELDAVDYQTVGFGSMASYTQPTGFLATTFPSGTVANTTNITGGTITTTTTLTNLPAIPTNWLTATGIASDAFTSAKFAAGAFGAVWGVTARTLSAFGFNVTVGANNDKTGYTLTTNEHNLIAIKTDERLLDAGDATDLIAGILTRLNNTNVNEAALVAAIRTDLERVSGFIVRLDANITSRNAIAPDNAGIVTLLAHVENVPAMVDIIVGRNGPNVPALASQIPAHFTNATFASPGVLSTGALANAPTGSGGGGGGGLTGPFTRTFTVTDSLTSAPIEGAAIRLYRTGESESQLTNASGVRVFTTDAFTFSYAITKGGFLGTTGTIAVSANGSTPIALVANVIAPAAGPNQCDCAANLVLRSGDPAVGWLVTAVPTAAMQIVNNAIILPTEESQATDATGQAVLRLVRLVEYKLTARKRSIEVSWVRTVPNTATATITLQA